MADMQRVAATFATAPRALRFFVIAALGVATGLGQAPIDAWYLSVPALAVLVWLYPRQNGRFWLGWAFGFGYFSFSLRWIIEPFLVDAARDGWMAPFALVLMAAGAAIFWGLAGWLARGRSWRLAVLLLLAEVARSLIFTGFPWGLLGHIWIETPITQLAAIGGPHLLTGVTLGLALAIATRPISAGAGIAALAIGWFSLVPGPAPDPAPDAPMVRLIQPNVPQNEKWDPILGLAHFDRMLAFTSAGDARPDLIVWPETAVTSLYEFAQPSFDLMAEAAQGAPLISGVQRRARESIYHNSMIVVDRGGEISGVYDKQHLVPFGEFFPGGELAARFGLYGFASSQGYGFSPGQGPDALQINGIGLARPLICYEGIFAEEIAPKGPRPRLMIMITNDAWFGKDAGPTQHLAQARLRAIEQGLPMVRVANTGISAMIDARGRVTGRIELGETAYLDLPLPPQLPITLFGRFGDWPLLALLAALCLLVLLSIRREFR